MKTVDWLRAQGHEAVHLRERNQQRLPDAEILSIALREDRIVVTMDLDFGYLLAVSLARLPSVVILRLEDETPSNVNLRLREVLKGSSTALREGAVVSVNEKGYRIRILPIQSRR